MKKAIEILMNLAFRVVMFIGLSYLIFNDFHKSVGLGLIMFFIFTQLNDIKEQLEKVNEDNIKTIQAKLSKIIQKLYEEKK